MAFRQPLFLFKTAQLKTQYCATAARENKHQQVQITYQLGKAAGNQQNGPFDQV
jgi:hypothetical protein